MYNNIFYLDGADAIVYKFQSNGDQSNSNYPNLVSDYNMYILKNQALLSKFEALSGGALIKSYGRGDFNTWKEDTQKDVHSIDATDQNIGFRDPENVQLVNRDFHVDPAASSPAMNSGMALRNVDQFLQVLKDFDGQDRADPPDIGPYEIQ